MLYRFITSGYPDKLAYASALLTAIWIYVAQHYTYALSGWLAAVSPLYGLAFAAFSGALLICKYICMEGHERTVKELVSEKTLLESIVIKRDLTVAQLREKSAELDSEVNSLRAQIVAMEANSPTVQLSELRRKLRASEEDKTTALTVLVKNLKQQLNALKDLHDEQLLFAANVLRKEIELLDNEIKQGELSYYELCLKIVGIGDNLAEMREIKLAADFEKSQKHGSADDVWLKFIMENDESDPPAVERSFKFFKVAFHPDRFATDTLKCEATRYFQHSINAHNALKRRKKTA